MDMRPGILLLTIFLVGNTVFSQSVFRFIGKGKRLRVERRIVTTISHQHLARRVLHSQSLTISRREVVRHPSRVVGPNSYLRGVSRAFRKEKGWEGINNGRGYNGAHHIVTRFVINQLGGNSECLRNAPSVFHPLHNHPEYVDWFHNHQKQLTIYQEKGIKGIITEFLENVGKDYTEAEKEQIMLEAELWAKHWGFVWEK